MTEPRPIITFARVVMPETNVLDVPNSAEIKNCIDWLQQVCSSRVRTAASPYTRAIDRFSRERHKPTRVLANPNATSHLRQSGGLSVRHV